MDRKQLFESIGNCIGVTGREKKISSVLETLYDEMGFEIVRDGLGSVFGLKRSLVPNAPKVLICAYMDESGFLVEKINADGKLCLIPMSAVQIEQYRGKRSLLRTASDSILEGIFIIEKEKLLVDMGTSYAKDTSALGISTGDSVVLKSEMLYLNQNTKVASRALQGRLGCILGVEILEELGDSTFDFDLYVGGLVQDRVGHRGAITSAYVVNPDLCITLTGFPVSDLKGTTAALGNGVMVSYMDPLLIPNQKLLKTIESVCQSEAIPYLPVFNQGSSSGGWIYKLNTGCPTISVGIGLENVGTESELIKLTDYESLKKMMRIYIQQLNAEMIYDFSGIRGDA